MDRPDKRSKKSRKPPRVPIKTYRWEDVRRSRKRGGYPWTYLYKQPFNETVDPTQFRMDSISRSKSTLNSGDGVSIQEVSDDGRDPSDSLQIVSEPDENSSTNPGLGAATAIGNVTIEECHSSDEKPNLESAESSDNISQYLDREEQPAKASTSSSTKEKEAITVENVEKPRAKSEEPKRKRKLSAESSYSRISLSKLGIMKKLKEGKDKLKATKISLPINKFKKPVPKKSSTKKETKKQQEASRLVISDKPVYIHIPLKPPPGQTDEFSYLEFEEKKPAAATTAITTTPTTTTTPAKQPLKINPAFKDLLKNIKKLNEEKAIEEAKSQENLNLEQNLKTELKVEESLKPKETLEIEDQNAESTKEVEKMETDSETKELKDDKPIFEKVKKEKGKGKGKSKIQTEELIIKMETEETAPPSTEAKTTKIFEIEEEIIDTDLQYSADEETAKSDKENEPVNVDFDELFKSKPTEAKSVQKARAKSEEPERKRKLSLESSYSRKSLSKLGILKRLKETSDKIKSTLSLSRLTSKKESKKEKEKPEEEVKKPTKKTKPTEIPKDPVYIHIPLKPPEGKTDEFSYLEYEGKPVSAPVEEKIDQTPTETTPSSIQTNDVQFIFLTAPSDDEILDDHSPEIPETPSSDQKSFFRIDDLKELAKNVVDKLSPTSQRKHLETVSEESVSKTSNDEEAMEAEEVDPQKLQVPMNFELDPNRDDLNKMMIDEEDGLKVECKDDKESAKDENETVDAKDELKSNLKTTDSPVLKKKVSFKRRSKDKDDDYEDVQPPAEEKRDETVLKASQSMSVEEEKPYLDEKIIKSASLEEDYNKWSKSSDHEYEPVNPPPDNPPAEIPSVRIIESPTSKWIIGEEVKEEEPKLKRATPEKVESRSDSSVHEDQPRGTSKFQKAIKDKTDQFKTKLKSIKRPHISMPQAPKFQKPKFNLPHLPKIPDTTVIHLPFKIPGASSKTTTTTTTTTSKRSLKERQLSTESNAGDSKKPLFDFSTYPRIFKRKSEPNKKLQSENVQAFTTIPRNGKKKTNKSADKETIRIPLHSEDSMDQELKDDFTKNENENFRDNNYREDSVEKRMSSHIRYDDDIDIDDDYHRENQQIHEAALKNEYSRWDHGSFVPDPNKEYFQNVKNQVTDLDSPEDENPQQYEPKTKSGGSYYSSESSLGTHRRGVLEEINSDEFFLRQKGISQDNIDMGIYLSSEIREAFRTPTSALSQMEGYGSNTSLPEIERHEKRKPIRKPKRKKTPHVSQEQIKSEFSQQILPPARPKRAGKKKKPVEEFIPYQETISVDINNEPPQEKGILARSDEEPAMYENEKMEGKEQPEIKITDPYIIGYFEEDEQYLEDKPPAPPRRHKSLKSLTSEHNSIITDTPYDKDDFDNFGMCKEEVHEYVTSAEKPPRRPARKRSRTRSHSRASSSMPTEEELQSMQETYSTDETPCTEDISYIGEVPCAEEPCIKNLCDYMGYSVVDKKQIRDPPLPPPRTPPRRRRSILAEETKFDTVPRVADKPPVRPLRNYSTLSHSRTPSRISSPAQEEKENIDITQYIEIEDESRDLQSGEVIQKMQNRPLPAPPRPPRQKGKPLKDITSEENIMKKLDNEENKEDAQYDFELEQTLNERPNSRNVEPRLITPSHYSYNEETITHGSLVVQPLNGSQILPDSELLRESRERIVPISREDSDEETSEIPEEFKSYKDPPVKQQPERRPMKGGKLQVTDLDVDRLTVNELMASKIVVSEIDSNNIQTTEISSKSGALKVGEISLPPGVVHDILEQLKAAVEERAAQELEQEQEEQEEQEEKSEQKKNFG